MIFKKSIKYLFMVAAVAIGFQSCSSDDDDEKTVEKTPAELVAGTYSGYSTGVSTYFSGMVGTDESVTLTPNTDGTVNVAYTSSTWGNTTLSNITVAKSGTDYALSGSGKYSMGHAGSSKEYDCTVSGTISADKATYSIAFSLPSVMGGLTITFQNGEPTVAQILNGTSFEGYSLGNATYFTNMLGQDETVAITGNEDGTVNIAYTSSTWGTGTFSNLTATKDGSNYVVSGSGKLTMSAHGSSKDYDAEVSATISSDKSTIAMTVTLPSVMGGTTLSFVNGEPTAAMILAGSYSGTNTMVMTYMPNGIDYADQTTTITANEDGTINITSKFTSTEDGTTTEMGNITLNNVTVTEDGDNYTFSVTGATYNMGMSGTLSEYACDVTGTISKDKSTFSIVYSLPAVMGGTTITFHN